jgi:ribosomal protein S6--L-glutamate ligase
MQKLRIGILNFANVAKTYSPGINGAKVIKEAAIKMGHKPVMYYVEKCQLYFNGRKSEILYNNKKTTRCDVIIPRVGINDNLDLEISIVKQFQMMGIPMLNGYMPILRAKNKLRTLQILTKNNIPVPKTVVVRKLEYIDDAIKRVSGYPVILKTPFGTWGAGVVLVESRRSLYSALDILWKNMSSDIMLIQEYIAEAEGSDYRAFVIGDRVVASMKRTAKTGDFRSNLHLGGEGQKVRLTEEEQKLAVRATQALGLKIAGVDILRSTKGPLIMEVNSNPGVAITQVTGVNVAEEMIRFAVEFAKKKQKS